MSEVLRQLAHSYQRTVAIVDHDHLEALEECWTALPEKLSTLSSLLHVPRNWNGNVSLNGKLDKFLQQDSFLEFIEKLVILELLQEPFLHDNFVSKNSFPFSHEGFIGHETALLNVFTFWNHYRAKYTKEMEAKKLVSAEKFEFWQKEMGYDHIPTKKDI